MDDFDDVYGSFRTRKRCAVVQIQGGSDESVRNRAHRQRKDQKTEADCTKAERIGESGAKPTRAANLTKTQKIGSSPAIKRRPGRPRKRSSALDPEQEVFVEICPGKHLTDPASAKLQLTCPQRAKEATETSNTSCLRPSSTSITRTGVPDAFSSDTSSPQSCSMGGGRDENKIPVSRSESHSMAASRGCNIARVLARGCEKDTCRGPVTQRCAASSFGPDEIEEPRALDQIINVIPRTRSLRPAKGGTCPRREPSPDHQMPYLQGIEIKRHSVLDSAQRDLTNAANQALRPPRRVKATNLEYLPWWPEDFVEPEEEPPLSYHLLSTSLEALFERCIFEMSLGFAAMWYGWGSKRRLLELFAKVLRERVRSDRTFRAANGNALRVERGSAFNDASDEEMNEDTAGRRRRLVSHSDPLARERLKSSSPSHSGNEKRLRLSTASGNVHAVGKLRSNACGEVPDEEITERAEGSERSVVVFTINGFDSTLSMCDTMKSLMSAIGLKPSTFVLTRQVSGIVDELKSQSELVLILVVHNIDGKGVSNDRFSFFFDRVFDLDNVMVVASVDSQRAALSPLLSGRGGKWTWKLLHTNESYEYETWYSIPRRDFEGTRCRKANFTEDDIGTDSAVAILLSLDATSRKVWKKLADLQIETMAKMAEEAKTKVELAKRNANKGTLKVKTKQKLWDTFDSFGDGTPKDEVMEAPVSDDVFGPSSGHDCVWKPLDTSSSVRFPSSIDPSMAPSSSIAGAQESELIFSTPTSQRQRASSSHTLANPVSPTIRRQRQGVGSASYSLTHPPATPKRQSTSLSQVSPRTPVNRVSRFVSTPSRRKPLSGSPIGLARTPGSSFWDRIKPVSPRGVNPFGTPSKTHSSAAARRAMDIQMSPHRKFLRSQHAVSRPASPSPLRLQRPSKHRLPQVPESPRIEVTDTRTQETRTHISVQYSGLPFRDFLRFCQQDFIVSSETHLVSILQTFTEHQMVVKRGGGKGGGKAGWASDLNKVLVKLPFKNANLELIWKEVAEHLIT